MQDAKEMMNDPELKELAEMEMLEAKEKLPQLEEELKILLIPKDKDDVVMFSVWNPYNLKNYLLLLIHL